MLDISNILSKLATVYHRRPRYTSFHLRNTASNLLFGLTTRNYEAKNYEAKLCK